jgi:large subunit ribosomal protein L15e
MYKHVASVWKKPKENLGEGYSQMMIYIRKQPTITKIGRPTRIDRARRLGYKAKEGYLVVRVKVDKGMRKTPKKGGRRPKKAGRFFSLSKSARVVAEEKASRKYSNLEVLNSYMLAEDGKSRWFEVILIDPYNKSVLSDRNKRWVFEPQHKGRAFRGKTSAGKKSRALLRKGRGAEKARPSLRANSRRQK